MLSEQAIENDQKSGLPLVKVKSIHTDKEFNCRGHISASDVVDLARDTSTRGLIEPIVVRKLWPNEEHLRAKGFEYFLVAGFRRHFAYRINEADVIPAIIREIKNDFDCKDLNACENLQRQDLNMLQEAKSILHYICAGWNREDIGKRVNKSPGWVQARKELLEMPEEIQTATAQGYLTQDDLKVLYKHRRDKPTMLKMAGLIRDRRKLGQKTPLKKVNVTKRAYEKKQRKASEIQDLMEEIREMCKTADFEKTVQIKELFSVHGNSMLTRVLGWACSYTTNAELYDGMEKLAKILDADYTKPQMNFEQNYNK